MKKAVYEIGGMSFFGGAVIKVFRSPKEYYEVNLTEAFSVWADKMSLIFQEENIQVCGTKLLESQHENEKIFVHELHSQQFVVLHSFSDHIAQKDFTTISESLAVEELFKYLEGKTWCDEQPIEITGELEERLLTRGYRIPSVRSIY